MPQEQWKLGLGASNKAWLVGEEPEIKPQMALQMGGQSPSIP